METKPEEWMPIATAPRDGTEVLVVPDSGYDRALFQGGFWFWSTPNNESIAAGPEPKGWKPLPFNVELTGAARLYAQRPATKGSEVERRVNHL
jgi:hypothetical protein